MYVYVKTIADMNFYKEKGCSDLSLIKDSSRRGHVIAHKNQKYPLYKKFTSNQEDTASVSCCDGNKGCEGLEGCYFNKNLMTYWDAIKACKDKGKRLCTQREMGPDNKCCDMEEGWCEGNLNWVQHCSSHDPSFFKLVYGKWYHVSKEPMGYDEGN